MSKSNQGQPRAALYDENHKLVRELDVVRQISGDYVVSQPKGFRPGLTVWICWPEHGISYGTHSLPKMLRMPANAWRVISP